MSEFIILMLVWCSGHCFAAISVHKGYSECLQARVDHPLFQPFVVERGALAIECMTYPAAAKLDEFRYIPPKEQSNE